MVQSSKLSVFGAGNSGRYMIPLLLLVVMVVGVPLVNAQVVAQFDFENGTQGWSTFNGASITTSTAEAQGGSQSILATTNSSGGSSGPSLNVGPVLLPGAKYNITGWVRLTSGETATNANFTILRNDPTCSGGVCFDTVGPFQVAVNDAGFAQIGGSYTVSTTETGMTLYAQLVGPNTTQTFYLDSVTITETSPPPGGTPVASFNFADGGLDGFGPFGSPTLSNAVSPIPDPAGNTHSLLTTNRTATFMGPSINLLNVNGIVAGATYSISAYVLLAAPDSSNPTATMTTKRTDCGNTTGAFANLGTSAALSSTAWTKVSGTLSFNNIPGAPTELTLFFQSNSATDSFYLSDVTIGQLAPPPLPVDQQDNTGISSTFEDGAVDGWSGRSGASTVTNVTGVSHSGSNSLLSSGRIGNFDGPQINVSNKMYVGSSYNISVWVMMQPVDGTSHIINMSLQTTLNGTTSFPGVSGFPGVTVVADGQWHQISVPHFNMSSPYDPGAAFLYLQTFPSSGSDLTSFYIDDFQLSFIPPPSIQENIPSVFETLQNFFPVGAEVDNTDLSGPHADLLIKHFNSLVSGNDMKWSSVENAKGSFNYGNADAQVGLAQCHNMKVRGHNLVWATGAQTPAYAFGDGTNSPANQAVVIANIQEHIQNEVTHFGNKVYVWDVVNEPIDENQPDCLVHGPFYNVLGKSYIDVALQAARQFAPPGTKLFINDFNTSIPAKLACVVKVVQDLQSRGIPIDGVGHEMHNSINFPSAASMETAIKTVAQLGVDQQVTELDLSVYNGGDNTSNYGANGGTVPPAIIAQQGYLYRQYFHVFRKLHRDLSGVTFWGLADDDTWLSSFPINRLNEPLLFDQNLQAKPAYFGVVDPRQLPGFDLDFRLTSKTGPVKARVWTVTARNDGPGTAYTVQINSLTLNQLFDFNRRKDQCTPVITPPSAFPISLGDIPQGSSASVSFTIDFKGCKFLDPFIVNMPWSSANGAHTGQLRVFPQLP